MADLLRVSSVGILIVFAAGCETETLGDVTSGQGGSGAATTGSGAAGDTGGTGGAGAASAWMDAEPSQVSAVWSVQLGGLESGFEATPFADTSLGLGLDGAGNALVTATFWNLNGGGLSHLVKLDPNGSEVWKKAFGRYKLTGGFTLSVHPGGDVALASDLWNEIDLGSGPVKPANDGPHAAFVAKLNGAGQPLWSRVGTSNQVPAITLLNSGDAAITNRLNAFVDPPVAEPIHGAASLGPMGELPWSWAVAGLNHSVFGVDRASGDVWVVTLSESAVDFGGGALSGSKGGLLGARFHANGDHVWSGVLGEVELNADGVPLLQLTGVVPTSAGTAMLHGSFQGSLQLGDDVYTSSGMDAFVLEVGGDGAPIWKKHLGGSGNQGVGEVVASGQDRFLLLTSNGVSDLGGGPIGAEGVLQSILAGVTATGAHTWSRAVPLVQGEGGVGGVPSLLVTPSGGLVFARHVACEQGAASQFAFSTVGPSGNFTAEHRVGDCQNSLIALGPAAIGSDNSPVFMGRFLGHINLGAGVHTTFSDSDLDVFVAKIPPL
ncbi:MAG: hypothetical protein IPK82_39365 [Polyangiaceae bacterium]|nr:hypothetical protein [Polyangiaceae bacterium]